MDLVKYDGNSTKYFMKLRKESIDDKDIVIYDDAFSGSEKYKLMCMFYEDSYTVNRTSAPFDNTKPTLKSNWSIAKLLGSGFLENPIIKDLILKNDLRVGDVYVNLSTASDLHIYHIDSDEEGNMTALYYGNTDWKVEWEGETHFTDNDLNDTKLSCGFVPGRLVLFDGRIPHKSSSPTVTADDYRYVLTLKLYTPTNSHYKDVLAIRDFYYTKPDTFTEKEENAISKIKELTQGMTHANGKTFFEHLYDVYSRLKSWGCNEDVCLAGLYHSILGTETYKVDKSIDENEIKNIVGDYSFELINKFSANNIDNRDLLIIQYANLLDQYTGQKETEETLIEIKKILEMEN